MQHIFLIHSPVSGHVACFHALVIVNSAAVNIGVQVSFQIIVFFGYMTRSRIAGSYGNSNFSFFEQLQGCFHSDCTSLHSHQQCRRVPWTVSFFKGEKHLLFTVVLFANNFTRRRDSIHVC